MECTGTYQINLDTPINMLTPRQLFTMLSDWQENNAPKADENAQVQKTDRWIVNSVGELAAEMGTSESTVYRMKREGLLDDCISQFGRWMMIDVNAVFEKFKLSNRRLKGKRISLRGGNPAHQKCKQ